MIARAGAATYQLVHVRHRTFPYRLFTLLRDGHAAEAIEGTPPCVLDEYSENFCTTYHGNLVGADALAELELVAALADTDSASTERLHSQNQRRAKFKVWMHPPDLTTMSAWAVARQMQPSTEQLDKLGHKKRGRRCKTQACQRRGRRCSSAAKKGAPNRRWRAMARVHPCARSRTTVDGGVDS